MRSALMLGAAALLAGCSGERGAVAGVSTAGTDWRSVATPGDRDRLRGWRTAWVQALAKARPRHAAALGAQGPLFAFDRALSGPLPPPGDYRCRVFKLGAAGTGALDYLAYPFFSCRIDAEGAVSSFYKRSGSQRPVGILFPDSATRAIFLGTLVLGDETAGLDYGADASRDMAGYVERVGPAHWRLVLPRPRFESILDVIELVPAT